MKRVAWALLGIALVLMEAARVYIWDTGTGTYEYSVVVYAVGVITPVAIAAVLYLAMGKSKVKE